MGSLFSSRFVAPSVYTCGVMLTAVVAGGGRVVFFVSILFAGFGGVLEDVDVVGFCRRRVV